MEFYSHNYLIHHATAFDWTQLVLFGFVALLMIFSLVHYMRDRKNSKYRELALIALFSFIFLGLLQLDRVLEVNQASKHYESIIASQENIARRLEVDSNHVYIAFDNQGNPSYLEVDGKYY
ncbi:MAG: DUF3290 domain-containing protein, partial [Atopobium sp.]|nr:DUF3290 domain-containing protein [Atopobium sp.]